MPVLQGCSSSPPIMTAAPQQQHLPQAQGLLRSGRAGLPKSPRATCQYLLMALILVSWKNVSCHRKEKKNSSKTLFCTLHFRTDIFGKWYNVSVAKLFANHRDSGPKVVFHWIWLSSIGLSLCFLKATGCYAIMDGSIWNCICISISIDMQL